MTHTPHKRPAPVPRDALMDDLNDLLCDLGTQEGLFRALWMMADESFEHMHPNGACCLELDAFMAVVDALWKLRDEMARNADRCIALVKQQKPVSMA